MQRLRPGVRVNVHFRFNRANFTLPLSLPDPIWSDLLPPNCHFWEIAYPSFFPIPISCSKQVIWHLIFVHSLLTPNDKSCLFLFQTIPLSSWSTHQSKTPLCLLSFSGLWYQFSLLYQIPTSQLDRVLLLFLYIYINIWLHRILVVLCGIFNLPCDMWTLTYWMWDLVSWSGMESGPLHWGCRLLATGAPRKSLESVF